MHTYSEKIKICKFNLFKKCKFGDKCKFKHIKIADISQMLNDLRCLKTENDLLRRMVQEKDKMTTNLKNNKSDASSNEVHACKNRLYSSFFKENELKSPAKNVKSKGTVNCNDNRLDDRMDCIDPNRNSSERKNDSKKRSEYVDLFNINDRIDNKIEKLNAELEIKIQNLLINQTRVKQKLQNVEERTDTLENEVVSCKKEVTGCRDEISGCKKEVTECKRELSKLSSQVHDSDNEIKSCITANNTTLIEQFVRMLSSKLSIS